MGAFSWGKKQVRKLPKETKEELILEILEHAATPAQPSGLIL